MKQKTSPIYLKQVFLLLICCAINSQDLWSQNRTYDSNYDPTTITLPQDEANPTKFKDMVGVNEVGYVFWDWVYNSSFSPSRIKNQSVVDDFKATFPKMRLFHLMEKDYNVAGVNTKYPSNSSTIAPCTMSGRSRDNMCAIRDFYDAMRPDYPFIASSMEALGSGRSFPNKWFTYNEWGGNNTSIKQEAKEYALAYLATMDPDKSINTAKVNRFYTSNEAWGGALGINGYKAVNEGFIQGFTQYYGTSNSNQWVIKMWLGAFQAHKSSHVWNNDFIGAMVNPTILNAIEGIDIHPYAFFQNSPSNNSPDISEHPESVNGYFQTIKSLVKWRNNNAPNLQMSATEFGWNDRDVYKRLGQPPWVILNKNNQPSTMTNYPQDTTDWKVLHPGVGQEGQALYSVRAYLLMARYGLESGYLYGTLNTNESLFENCGVYDTAPLINLIPVGNGTNHVNYSNYPSAASDFIGEKLIMPAMRKLQNTNIIGDKKYLEVLKEDDNGANAILVGDNAGNPTHLVAWYGTNINKKSEGQILGTTLNKTLAQINFPSNLAIVTNQNYTRLDWKENQFNNVAVNSVYNSNTETLVLTPIPIVIPVSSSGGGGTSCDNIAGFTKLGEYNGHGYYKSNSNATSWNQAQALSAAQGGYLVSIEDQGEKDFVDGFISGTSGDKIYYIGLSKNGGNYTWTSGANLNISNYSSSPWESAPTQNFTTLRKWQPHLDVKWGTENGFAHRRYIMEKECGNTCGNQGGDSDGDGVCNNVDCAPNDSSLPTTPGTACDDGNASTSNDVIQTDGCTCLGETTSCTNYSCSSGVIIEVCGLTITAYITDSDVQAIYVQNSSWQVVDMLCTNWGDPNHPNCYGSGDPSITLAAGTYRIKVTRQGGANCENYPVVVSGSSNRIANDIAYDFQIVPNPANDIAYDLQIVPNPANDQASLLLNNSWAKGILEVHISSMDGRTIKTETIDYQGKQKIQLDVSDLTNGNYLISVTSKETNQIKVGTLIVSQ